MPPTIRPSLRPSLFARPRLNVRPQWRRNQSTNASTKPTAASRADRILTRLPPFLQKYTTRLRSVPVSHIVAFLILHEITAIVPLVGLFGVFHYTNLVPLAGMVDRWGGYVEEGAGRWERYLRRKGWFGFSKEDSEGGEVVKRDGGEAVKRWEGGDKRYQAVVELGLAYAITKALLPVRILGSVWATPWFAGVLGRLRRLGRR